MRRLPFVLALLVLGTAMPAQQKLGPVDWVFLVDTSKSMKGIGKNAKNIWTDVKVALDSFVREAGPDDTLTLYAFDRDVREIGTGDLRRAMFELDATGNRTHLGAAIAKGLERAEQLRSVSRDATRRQVVVLFTDGKEDIEGIENPIRIDANVARAGDTFVFFVSMGEHEPQLDAFAANVKHAEVLAAPSADAIRNIAQRIREKMPARPPKPVAPVKVVPIAPIQAPSPIATLIKAAVALALLILIAILAIAQQRKKNRLEGELEILRPRAAPDAAFIGLPKLQANEVALSAILPVDALAGSDARLFVRRTAGRKKVWIAAQSGSLRINDVETPMGELYDADTIEIGDAKVRFNRVGDERPVETNQEGDL
ncbi:MAG TPA: vWA domain-containing protein [Thermoanaerobaculia bacterium]|nr:vWA domain-containing protein [Thermoanaerobaculia bacterium]